MPGFTKKVRLYDIITNSAIVNPRVNIIGDLFQATKLKYNALTITHDPITQK
jgi:hypothetical protein